MASFSNLWLQAPEHNSVAEHKNCTLIEGTRCILQQAGLDNKFWADTVYFTNYVGNRAPTKIVENSTPYELMSGHKPDISNLHVFRCPAAVLIQTQLLKLASKINKCLYIGLNQEGEGDRFYNLSTRKIIVSWNATFFENVAHPINNFITGTNAGLLPAPSAPVTSTAVYTFSALLSFNL